MKIIGGIAEMFARQFFAFIPSLPHASLRPFHQNSPFFEKIFPKTNVHHVILHIFVIQI